MSCANKTARISIGGYYPPHGLYDPMEPCEEEPQEQEVDSPAHAPAPTPEPLQEEPEVEEDVEVIELEDEEEDAVQEHEPPHAMGWTMKIYYKPGCESFISHRRLMGILQVYYADWDAAVEYVYNEHTYPLEDTY